MFEKIDVNGTNAHPLYKFLTDTRPGLLGSRSVKWNFTKFLVSREGLPIARYGSAKKPGDLEGLIRKIL